MHLAIGITFAALQLLQGPAASGRSSAAAAAGADTGVMHHSNGRAAPVAEVRRLTAETIHLDGHLDEGAWTSAPPVTAFTQMNPHEGDPATERTDVRFLYDGEAIYVGARMFDSDARAIRTELARRDASTAADQIEVAFDSYHDHLSAFVFGVNPSGVKTDRLIGNDGFAFNDGWDPVWAVATSRDSLGWTAEMRIPLSQIRYAAVRHQVWGVNVFRHIERKAEDVRFGWSRPSDRGYASYFGHLVGLEGLPQPQRLEVMPYVTTRQERIHPGAPNDPFNDGSRELSGAGVDLKYGLTSNLTLDATFNPDFGQVEADPAYVNLSAFEQFFEERRPFFIEGADIFQFSGQQFFYSRRIGRSPQGAPDDRGGYVDVPANATILGAAKLSGRTASGWSIGILDAVTQREFAAVDSAGVRFSDEVEPATNYFVGRGRRDFRGGSDRIGFIATAVNRRMDSSRLDFLRDNAFALGADFTHRFGHNAYNLSGSIGLSRIAGDTLAMRAAQRSSARYYQRPDADYVEFDPLRTSLSGWTGQLSLGKEAGAYQFGLFADATSPGFEINDGGFQTSADDIDFYGFVNRRWTKPGRVFRFLFLGNNVSVSDNFGWVRTSTQYNFNAFGTFLNYWNTDAHFSYVFRTLSDGLTRGGPLAYSPSSWNVSLGGSTDSRKWLSASLSTSYAANERGGTGTFVYAGLTLRPSSNVNASVGPSYSHTNSIFQFVKAQDDPAAAATFGRQYIFAQVRQHSIDLTTRLNVTFTPTVSLQLYAQPFAATGDYYRFKELARARSMEYVVYGEAPGSTQTCYDAADELLPCGGAAPAAYVVADPDGAGPRRSVTIFNPDFNVRSLHGNAVMRWEYRPGSTLFLVWTSQCSRSGTQPDFSATHDVQHLCQGPSDNVFAVKMNYWLSF